MSAVFQKLVERSGSWFIKIKVMIFKWRILTICLWISLGHIATGQQQIPTTPDNVCAPNPPPLSAEQLSLPFSTCSRKVKESLAARHPDQNKLTVCTFYKITIIRGKKKVFVVIFTTFTNSHKYLKRTTTHMKHTK